MCLKNGSVGPARPCCFPVLKRCGKGRRGLPCLYSFQKPATTSIIVPKHYDYNLRAAAQCRRPLFSIYRRTLAGGNMPRLGVRLGMYFRRRDVQAGSPPGHLWAGDGQAGSPPGHRSFWKKRCPGRESAWASMGRRWPGRESAWSSKFLEDEMSRLGVRLGIVF